MGTSVRPCAAAELAKLNDRLERVADDYDRVKRSLAWSEEIRHDEAEEAANKVAAAEAEASKVTL